MPPKKKTEDTPAPEPDDTVNPAEAAAAEVLDDTVTFTFRGQKFEVPRDRLQSARFMIAIASGQDHRIMVETLDPRKDIDRFMATLRVGETLPVVAAEYLGALSKAAGWGNS